MNTTKKTLGLLVDLDTRNPRIEFFNDNGNFYVEAIPCTPATAVMYGTYPVGVTYLQLGDDSVSIIDWELTCKEIEDYPTLFSSDGQCTSPAILQPIQEAS